MKHKLTLKMMLVSWVLLLTGGMATAQNPLYLYMDAGLGTIDNYDIGTVPYHIKGAAKTKDFGASYAWKRCQIQMDVRSFNGTLTTLSGTTQAYDLNLEFLYRCIDSESNRFHYYAGAALEGYGEIKVVPDLQNASLGITLFGNLCDVNMVSFDFAFNKAKTHPWLTAYGKLTLPIVGTVNRPGYSYTYDTQGMGYFDKLFAGHETFGKFFPGCSTDFGLYLNLKNGNRIGLDYRWDYLSTGDKGTWRYDNAYHTLNLSFMFKIK